MWHGNYGFRNANRWLPSLICLNATVVAAITAVNVAWPSSVAARTFVLLALLAHALALTIVLSAPAMLAALLLRSRRGIIMVAAGCMTTWVSLVLVDARVYAMFGFHINALVVGLLIDNELIDQLGLPRLAYALILSAVVALLIVQIMVARAFERRARPSIRPIPFFATTALAALFTQGGAIWSDANGRSSVMASLDGIAWSHTPTARSKLKKWGLAPDSDDGRARGNTERPAQSTREAQLSCTQKSPSNLLMIVVDSLRFDMLRPDTMPNTHGLLKDSWSAEQHYSTGNNTLHGLFGLFYGRPAIHTTAMINMRRGPELLREMQRRGYDMYLWGSASLKGARADRAVFAETDAPLHTAPPQVPLDERDRYVTKKLSEALRLQSPDRPFFGFILLDGPHAPYAVPVGAEQKYTPQSPAGAHILAGSKTDRRPLFNRYRNAVIEVDKRIAELIEAVDSSQIGQNTVVVVTSDHGESFNDLQLGHWGHNSSFSDYQVRVPMLIRWPGRPAHSETKVTSHIDVAPTLMKNMLGCDAGTDEYYVGKDMFASLPDKRHLLIESWSTRAVRWGEWTYIPSPRGFKVLDLDYRPTSPAEDASVDISEIIDQMRNRY